MHVSWDSEFRQYEIFGDLSEWQRILVHSDNPKAVAKAQTVLDCLSQWPRHFYHAEPGMPGEFRVRLSLAHWHAIVPAAIAAGVIGRAVTADTADGAGPWHDARYCHRSVGERGGVKTYTRQWRRTGRTKRWVTRPTEFTIPVKYGAGNTYDYITETTGISRHAAKDCPYGL